MQEDFMQDLDYYKKIANKLRGKQNWGQMERKK